MLHSMKIYRIEDTISATFQTSSLQLAELESRCKVFFCHVVETEPVADIFPTSTFPYSQLGLKTLR